MQWMAFRGSLLWTGWENGHAAQPHADFQKLGRQSARICSLMLGNCSCNWLLWCLWEADTGHKALCPVSDQLGRIYRSTRTDAAC